MSFCCCWLMLFFSLSGGREDVACWTAEADQTPRGSVSAELVPAHRTDPLLIFLIFFQYPSRHTFFFPSIAHLPPELPLPSQLPLFAAVLAQRLLLLRVFNHHLILPSTFVIIAPPQRFRAISLLTETCFHLHRDSTGKGRGVDYRGGGANPLPAGWKSREVMIFSGGAGETQHRRGSRFSSDRPSFPSVPLFSLSKPRCAPVKEVIHLCVCQGEMTKSHSDRLLLWRLVWMDLHCFDASTLLSFLSQNQIPPTSLSFYSFESYLPM